MPQLVEPTTPDAQREMIRQSLDEIATEVARHSRRSSGLSGFSDSPSQWGFACNDGMSSRPVRQQTGHMHPRSFVASSGNDWVTFSCADGH